MKKLLSLAGLALVFQVNAQEEVFDTNAYYNALMAQIMQTDSLEKSLVYEYGTIQLPSANITIEVPQGFKYLNAEQSRKVLVDWWGNPDGDDISLGMIMPEWYRVLGDSGYAFNLEYDPMGYVDDDDAEDIDYNDLLEELQSGEAEENQQRIDMGYEPVHMMGWASAPFYDADHHVLHWAKELKFGDSEYNTLNYNVRYLGRKGIFVANAIGGMKDLPLVQEGIQPLMTSIKFNEGFTYADFDSSIDDVAAWTIGGLVAGKMLAKTGILVLLLKFWKIILVALAAAGAGIKRFLGMKKENKAIPVVVEPRNEGDKEEVKF